jgi:UDP-N-acetylmuramoyl-L-alanyl-D-glutamate--2,6-diaminopimelate ligase
MNLLRKLIPQKIINYYHLTQAILANVWFGFPASRRRAFLFTSRGGPAKKIKVIGVTGTNGKTTTCQMIAKILAEAGYKTALASTINFKIGDKIWANETKFTTLSSFKTQRFIKQAAEAECEYLILEVSSHSLDQNRLWGVKFDTAVITNVTREHLDYHKTMENYRWAKLKLFKNAKNVVANLDVKEPEEFLKYNNGRKMVYACHPERSEGSRDSSPAKRDQNDKIIKPGMTLVKAENIELGIDYTKYQILDTKFFLNLPGLFNVENALAATCVGLSQGIGLKKIKIALEKIKGVPGRMERVENNKNLNIIIDYAVTPDSLEKLYELIKTMKCHSCGSRNPVNETKDARLDSRFCGNDNDSTKSKIIAVFGACGDRDRGKRPIMGETVSQYADYIILTNEDPYNENPWQIINEVAQGIKDKKENINLWRILDRHEAIKKALALSESGDYIIVTGKGAETSMAIGKKRIPWSDKKVIQEVLRESA